MKRIVPYLVAFYTLIVRWTCRLRVHNDPRAEMTKAGIPHVFAALHAHQIAAMVSADPGTGAMVSRSQDGQIIVPALRANGHVPVRGSSGKSDKGGATALKALIEYLGVGKPVILAVDGPRGPRGNVHKGIGVLARKSGAGVLPVLVITNRRYILKNTWDRLQLPLPFGKIEAFFAPPMYQNKGEKLDDFAQRIQNQLARLEQQHDPAEAGHVLPHASSTNRRTRRAA
jgi:lysophospholipid acyltransferase (LPLAT)-like uncharacterized protein